MRRGIWHPYPVLSCILTDIIIVKLGTWFHLSCRCGSLKLHSMGLCRISSVNFPLAVVQKGGLATHSPRNSHPASGPHHPQTIWYADSSFASTIFAGGGAALVADIMI